VGPSLAGGVIVKTVFFSWVIALSILRLPSTAYASDERTIPGLLENRGLSRILEEHRLEQLHLDSRNPERLADYYRRLTEEPARPLCKDDFILPLEQGDPIPKSEFPSGDRLSEEVLDEKIRKRQGDRSTLRTFKNYVMLKQRIFELDQDLENLKDAAKAKGELQRIFQLKRQQSFKLREAQTTLEGLMKKGLRTKIAYENVGALLAALDRQPIGTPIEFGRGDKNKTFISPEDAEHVPPPASEIDRNFLRAIELVQKLTENPPNEVPRDQWENCVHRMR
jgi:hypothetical protein